MRVLAYSFSVLIFASFAAPLHAQSDMSDVKNEFQELQSDYESAIERAHGIIGQVETLEDKQPSFFDPMNQGLWVLWALGAIALIVLLALRKHIIDRRSPRQTPKPVVSSPPQVQIEHKTTQKRHLVRPARIVKIKVRKVKN